MFTNIKNNFWLILLIIILITSGGLRLYQLDQNPPSLSWDEAAVGYNAWTIANYGRDEWGILAPLTFRSFEENKNPIHVYITALVVRIFGLSDFTTRLPSALFGVANVFLLFVLAKTIFSSRAAGLLAAFFLVVSPFSLQFSRHNHEANIALFFFMAGVLFFYKSLKGRANFLSLSVLFLLISIVSYNAAKLIVPLLAAFLMISNLNLLKKMKKQLVGVAVVVAVFLGLVVISPELLGLTRMTQVATSTETIKQTEIFQKTNNLFLGKLDLTWQRYLYYLSPNYLFLSGDPQPKHSIQTIGEFYFIDGLFLLIGLIGVIIKRNKWSLFVVFWALIAPLPGSIWGGEGEIGHAGRAMFMMGSWHLISAFGCYLLIKAFPKTIPRAIIVVIFLFLILTQFKDYLVSYYGSYSEKYAIEWQYGMKQISEYLNIHNEYYQVYITDVRSQPYIFLLYNLKIPLPEFRSTLQYNVSGSRSHNLISSFGRYYFGGWNTVESQPRPYVLYILSPSEYDGLRNKNIFDVKKIIRYPNGTDAFFIVGVN